MPEERQRRVEKALFHGARLTLENPAYLSVLRSLLDALLVPDLSPRDLTVAALGIKNRPARLRCWRASREWRRGWRNMRGCSASTD